ncbi:MAG: 4'-phosphopantetheinyl transferase family protein [Pseudonocardiaceae bacterium]
MIEKILPDVLACSEAFDDPLDAVLFPEEEAVISRAVEKRRREFRTVRLRARRALRELNLPPVAVLPGEHREPLWPPGVVGSMTHCTGYRAAVVAHSRNLITVGIDAEPHEPLPPDVMDGIALDEELIRHAKLATTKGAVCWDRVLFCAKETVYKAWFPLAHRWLGFQEANVTIDPPTMDHTEGTFSARLPVAGPMIAGEQLTGFDGRWLITDNLVITAIAVSPTK